MAIPLAAINRIISNRRSASDSVSTAVGSSNTRSFIPVLSISLAISINCIYPIGKPATLTYSSILSPIVDSAFLESFFILSKSKVSKLFPNTLLSKLGLLISLPTLIFSVTVNPGISMNS